MAGVRRRPRVDQLVYGRVTKLVPFGAFVQVGDGIEGLVHISEMAAQHVEAPEQVVTPGEELWVKIIDIDLDRRRISLSIKQAAEGGEVAAEYHDQFGEHAYDEQGNYIGPAITEGEAEAEPRLTPGGRRPNGGDGTATEAARRSGAAEVVAPRPIARNAAPSAAPEAPEAAPRRRPRVPRPEQAARCCSSG